MSVWQGLFIPKARLWPDWGRVPAQWGVEQTAQRQGAGVRAQNFDLSDLPEDRFLRIQNLSSYSRP